MTVLVSSAPNTQRGLICYNPNLIYPRLWHPFQIGSNDLIPLLFPGAAVCRPTFWQNEQLSNCATENYFSHEVDYDIINNYISLTNKQKLFNLYKHLIMGGPTLTD